jgi:hypothetical protein
VGANTLFSPTAAGSYTFTVTATNAYGCSAAVSVTITVIDARCDNNKVVMCHQGKLICINPESVQDHLSHGCRLGACTAPAGAANARLAQNQPQVPPTSMLIYPNPLAKTGMVEFTLPAAGPYSLEIYDTKGALVHTISRGSGEDQQFFALALDAANLKPGVYLVKLVAQHLVQTQRLVE